MDTVPPWAKKEHHPARVARFFVGSYRHGVETPVVPQQRSPCLGHPDVDEDGRSLKVEGFLALL